MENGQEPAGCVEPEVEEASAWANGLEQMGGRIRRHFARGGPFRRAMAYLKGLLGVAERKNGWQLAEAAGNKTPYGMQNLLHRSVWDADGVRDDLQSYVKEHLAEPEGVAVLDETGFVKKGDKSVGVQRQYSGTAGRIENCQVGVFLGYATSKARVLIDRALYLPESWTKDPERCGEAEVPEGTTFKAKSQLGRELLERAFEHGLPISWVTGDEVYGRDGKLRRWLEQQERPFVLAVASNHYVWLGFEQLTVSQLPIPAWRRLSAGAGSKGPRLYDWALIPVNGFADNPDWRRWILIRRNVERPDELAYYAVSAPAQTTLAEMLRVAGTRWTIEECFEMAKNEVGLDQYEVRQWTGWYRHITLSMMALAFLVTVQKQKAEKRGRLRQSLSRKTGSLQAFRQQRQQQESRQRISSR